MSSRLLCCFGYRGNEDQFLEKDMVKNDLVRRLPKDRDKKAFNRTVIQSQFTDINHTTSKVIIEHFV